jgi:hypothetical protein
VQDQNPALFTYALSSWVFLVVSLVHVQTCRVHRYVRDVGYFGLAQQQCVITYQSVAEAVQCIVPVYTVHLPNVPVPRPIRPENIPVCNVMLRRYTVDYYVNFLGSVLCLVPV